MPKALDAEWAPPSTIEVLYERDAKHVFSGINKPTAGARVEKAVLVGDAALQLYSLATPNGQKVGIILEELGIEYDAWVTNIGRGEQFTSGFVEINPNSKIPCAVDREPADGGPAVKLFESGAILVYLAEKYNRFIPQDARQRAQCMSWLMWQMAGQGPMTGNFGHFFVYAPGNQVSTRNYGAEVLPWFQMLRTAKGYKHHTGVAARDFLSISQYKHAARWADVLIARPAVQRGLLVCRKYGKPWIEDDRFKHLAKL
eukprot:gene393-5010_t